MKKYVRYFLVTEKKECLYIKLESDLPFGVGEAKKWLKESRPNATKFVHLATAKAEQFLNLFNKS